MVDVVTLVLARRIAESMGGTISPEEIQEAVNNYLEEHPVQSTPIDPTLTLENYAADAKAVGDAITEIMTKLDGVMDLKSISDEDIANLFK